MSYFRAHAHLIAQMVQKDVLRYTADNLASLLVVFAFPAKTGDHHYLAARLIGDLAESISRTDLNNAWFEVKGILRDSSPAFESLSLPAMSISVSTITSLPPARKSVFLCDVIGRLTHDPEHVIKNENFEFCRFSVAVNPSQSEKAHYFSVSVFKSKLIQEVNHQLKKGNEVFISGEVTFYEKAIDHKVFAAIKLEQFVQFSPST